MWAFERDSYLRVLETSVVSAGREAGRFFAVTADTIFYPEGGGQPADHGFCGEAAVVDVQKVEGEIRHYLDGEVGIGPASLRLDWGRRWDHMQQHTGQHVLTAVAEGSFGWATTAFHLGEAVSDVELAAPALGEGQLRELEEAVNQEILQARPVSSRCVEPAALDELGVRSRGLPEGHQGAVRLVEIEGLDLNTCGGTHLRSTAEIGCLVLLGAEQLRGGTRVFFAAGDRVRRRMAAHEARNARLRALLGAPEEEFAEITERRLEKERELQRALKRSTAELAEQTVAAMIGSGEQVVAGHWPEAQMPFLQQVARRLQSEAPAKIALLTAGDGDAGTFVLAAGKDSGCDLQAVFTSVCEALDGRGGGVGGLFQGKAARIDRRALAVEALTR